MTDSVNKMDYKTSGVDIIKGRSFVEYLTVRGLTDI